MDTDSIISKKSELIINFYFYFFQLLWNYDHTVEVLLAVSGFAVEFLCLITLMDLVIKGSHIIEDGEDFYVKSSFQYEFSQVYLARNL